MGRLPGSPASYTKYVSSVYSRGRDEPRLTKAQRRAIIESGREWLIKVHPEAAYDMIPTDELVPDVKVNAMEVQHIVRLAKPRQTKKWLCACGERALKGGTQLDLVTGSTHGYVECCAVTVVPEVVEEGEEVTCPQTG